MTASKHDCHLNPARMQYRWIGPAEQKIIFHVSPGNFLLSHTSYCLTRIRTQWVKPIIDGLIHVLIFNFYKSVTWNVHIIIHGLHEHCAYGHFIC